MVDFLDRHGISLGAANPQGLEATPLELMQQHVVVSLQGPISGYFEQLPFHTTPLEWDVSPAPEESAAFEGWLEEVYRTMATRIRDLMELLRGEDPP